MKLTLKNPKPRNPLVAPSLQRKAGMHRTAAARAASRPRPRCGAKSNACDPSPEPTREPARQRPGRPLKTIMLRDLPYVDALPEDRRARNLVAAALRAGSRALDRLACAWPMSRRAHGRAVLEFYAEAGAPEGALYVDGRLVGIVPGVNRL